MFERVRLEQMVIEKIKATWFRMEKELVSLVRTIFNKNIFEKISKKISKKNLN